MVADPKHADLSGTREKDALQDKAWPLSAMFLGRRINEHVQWMQRINETCCELKMRFLKGQRQRLGGLLLRLICNTRSDSGSCGLDSSSSAFFCERCLNHRRVPNNNIGVALQFDWLRGRNEANRQYCLSCSGHYLRRRSQQAR